MRISKRIVLSSIVCMLPLTVSALLYEQLPEQMPIHWNSMGEADGFIEKNIGVWALPFLMLAIHLAVAVRTENSKSRQQLSAVTCGLCFWSVPMASATLLPLSLFRAAGYALPVTRIVTAAVGVLFIAAGNYLPKNRTNSIAGYRLPRTQNDPDNWNKTHRFAGAVWVVCGFAFILISLMLPGSRLTILAILAVTAALLSPAVYSCLAKS